MAKEKFNRNGNAKVEDAEPVKIEEQLTQEGGPESIVHDYVAGDIQDTDVVDTEAKEPTDTGVDTGEDKEPVQEGPEEEPKKEGEDDEPKNSQGPEDESVNDNDELPPVVLTVEEELVRIEKLIADIEIDTDGTLLEISKSSILSFSVLAARLMDYRDNMHRSKGVMDVKAGANKNSQLLKSIMNILGNKDDKYFRIGFDLINVVFKTYNNEDEAYNKYSLTRYDNGWDNQKDLNTYNKLATVIPMLADASTREQEKVHIKFDKLRDSSKLNFTDAIVNRLVSYYNI